MIFVVINKLALHRFLAQLKRLYWWLLHAHCWLLIHLEGTPFEHPLITPYLKVRKEKFE